MEDSFGEPVLSTIRPFENGRTDANLFANLAEDYTGAPNLPEDIPPVIADDGGIDFATGVARPDLGDNRVIDDSEFAVTAATMNGSFSGGKISVIAAGQSVSTPAEQAAMRDGLNTSLASSTDGNVYLRGTEDNPILLDGSIAIDGDVIISGYVKGSGHLTARGNVFVASDLVYADQESGTQRKFGQAADGTENLLTLAAGGNIVVGVTSAPTMRRRPSRAFLEVATAPSTRRCSRSPSSTARSGPGPSPRCRALTRSGRRSARRPSSIPR